MIVDSPGMNKVLGSILRSMGLDILAHIKCFALFGLKGVLVVQVDLDLVLEPKVTLSA